MCGNFGLLAATAEAMALATEIVRQMSEITTMRGAQSYGMLVEISTAPPAAAAGVEADVEAETAAAVPWAVSGRARARAPVVFKRVNGKPQVAGDDVTSQWIRRPSDPRLSCHCRRRHFFRHSS